jgi:hypothetical protein
MLRRRSAVALAFRAALCTAALVTLVLARRPAPPASATAALRGAEPAAVATTPSLPFVRVALALILLGGLAVELRRRPAWR